MRYASTFDGAAGLEGDLGCVEGLPLDAGVGVEDLGCEATAGADLLEATTGVVVGVEAAAGTATGVCVGVEAVDAAFTTM